MMRGPVRDIRRLSPARPLRRETIRIGPDGVEIIKKRTSKGALSLFAKQAHLLIVVASMNRFSSKLFLHLRASMTFISMVSLPRTPTTLPL